MAENEESIERDHPPIPQKDITCDWWYPVQPKHLSPRKCRQEASSQTSQGRCSASWGVMARDPWSQPVPPRFSLLGSSLGCHSTKTLLASKLDSALLMP